MITAVKKLILVFSAIFMLGGVGVCYADSSIKEVTKEGVEGTKKGVKKGVEGTKKGVKNGVEGTKKGANTVKNSKTLDKTKKTAKKIFKGE